MNTTSKTIAVACRRDRRGPHGRAPSREALTLDDHHGRAAKAANRTKATAAIYAKDVTHEGIARQVTECRSNAKSAGMCVVAVYADLARAGTDGMLNEGMAAMRSDVEAGRFTTIVVEDVDRLSRDMSSLDDFFRFLDRHGVAVRMPRRGVVRHEDVVMRGLMADRGRTLLTERACHGRNRLRSDEAGGE